MTAIENEYEAQFFGFTPHGYVNFTFNNLVESWASIVDQELMPALIALSENDPAANITKQTKATLRCKLLDRLFQHGKLDVILAEAQKHLARYIIRIPKNVTLPEDEVNLAVKGYNEEELNDHIKQLSQEILNLHLKLKLRNINMMEKKAQKLLEDSTTMNNNSTPPKHHASESTTMEVENDGETENFE